MTRKYKTYVFGPVPTRRLGRSLGVELVPFKICSYDCIYCQLGRTTCKTIARKEWVPMDQVLLDIQNKLDTHPDYITLSGSGEPTLHSSIGVLINRIHQYTDLPVAVLTNGSLLWQPEVRRQLLHADLVIPSLDAGNETMFQAVNRPHRELSHQQVLKGLIEFRREFSGQIWLKIFLLSSHTVIESELMQLKDCVEQIQPDKVQLNTVTRPPSEYFAESVSQTQLHQIATIFEPPVDVIVDYHKGCRQDAFVSKSDDILNLLQRRLCTLEDIVTGLRMNRNDALKQIEILIKENIVVHSFINGKIYYKS